MARKLLKAANLSTMGGGKLRAKSGLKDEIPGFEPAAGRAFCSIKQAPMLVKNPFPLP